MLNEKQILSLGSSIEEEMWKLVGTLEMTGPAPWLGKWVPKAGQSKAAGSHRQNQEQQSVSHSTALPCQPPALMLYLEKW